MLVYVNWNLLLILEQIKITVHQRRRGPARTYIGIDFTNFTCIKLYSDLKWFVEGQINITDKHLINLESSIQVNILYGIPKSNPKFLTF